MKKQEVIRLYNFSDGTLVTKGLEKAAFMLRDQAQFQTYGITIALIEALRDSLNVFATRITDVEALGDQSQVTLNKDLKAEEIRTAIRAVMARTELKFGVNSPKYKKFGTEELARQTDAELHITAKRVVRVATEYLDLLSDTGLIQAQLDAITAMDEEFTTLLVDLKIEIGNRDIEQEDRVEAGNVIYNTLVKYTNIGQNIWETNDVAKFNDYVLYNTISGEEEESTPAA